MTAVLVALAGLAFADVVPSPPTDCPDGAHPRTSHAGPYCERPAGSCDATTTCEGDAVCAPIKLCVYDREVSNRRKGSTYTQHRVAGECAADGSCEQGSCESFEVCRSKPAEVETPEPEAETPEADAEPPKPEEEAPETEAVTPPTEEPPPSEKRCATVGGSAAFLGAILLPLCLRRRRRGG